MSAPAAALCTGGEEDRCIKKCVNFRPANKEDQFSCGWCGHDLACHPGAASSSSAVAAPAPAAVSMSSRPRAVMVQMWNIETFLREESHMIRLKEASWTELEAKVREAFKSHWTEANKGRFALYYLQDLQQPVHSRVDVSNQEQLEEYFAFLDKPPRDRGLMLFLNVAVIFQASGKPVSPGKPPLSIDTALARAHNAGRRQGFASASHFSPDSATSPQSPGTPRQKEFRQMVLARDSDECMRPDKALLQSPPPAIFRCVFCQTRLQPFPKQIEACHVVPHSERERLGKALEVEQQLAIGGSTEDVANGVSVCSICHGMFDSGLLWVEVQSDGTQLIHVDEGSRQVTHFHPLHGKPVRMPPNPAFPFPGQVAWRWRMEWAVLKRQDTADKAAEKLAKLSLGGACPGSCAGKPKNKACKNGLCKPCCDKTDAGCFVHPLSGRPVAVAGSAASSPTAAR